MNRIKEMVGMALMTLEELAVYLRVTKKTIYRLLEKGNIPAKKVGQQWRFDKVDIDSWLSESSKRDEVRILVIDDEKEICSLFKDALDGSGVLVSIANDSLQGLELIKEHVFDLVFLDLKMPKMNGAELHRKIKEIKPDLPVTIITGYPDSDLMMEALTYGPLGVMKKPFSGSDVMTAVNSYLSLGSMIKNDMKGDDI